MLTVVPAWSVQDPIKLETGDVLRVDVIGFKSLSGTFTVLSDGTISVPRIGSVPVRGKSLDEVRDDVAERFAKIVKNPDVDVSLVSERPRVVYVAGVVAGSGVVDWVPGMGIRQLIAVASLPDPIDTYEATLYRSGQKPQAIALQDIVSADGGEDVTLLPGDLVAILPLRSIRVWVLGPVFQPGEFRVEKGATIAQAIGMAGGIVPEDFALSEVTVRVRRGSRTIEMSGLADDPLASTPIEHGDTVLVALPVQRRFSLAGHVVTSGELLVPDGTTVLEAIERGGGKSELGTLKSVMVFRGGETHVFDLTALSKGQPSLGPIIEQGDLIYVPDNKDDFYVFGFVEQPGRFLFPDERPVQLIDALEQAGGLADRGVLRRVVLLRPDPSGRLVPHRHNLDEFVRDGNLDGNPLLEPGDVVYFQQNDSRDLGGVVRIVSSLLLLDRIVG